VNCRKFRCCETDRLLVQYIHSISRTCYVWGDIVSVYQLWMDRAPDFVSVMFLGGLRLAQAVMVSLTSVKKGAVSLARKLAQSS
jgi:hypothetical protein